MLATFKNLSAERVQPDKAALLSAGPVLVHVTLKSKLARLLSIYPILKPKISKLGRYFGGFLSGSSTIRTLQSI